MDQSLDTILGLLKLERLEVNLFRGQSPTSNASAFLAGRCLAKR